MALPWRNINWKFRLTRGVNNFPVCLPLLRTGWHCYRVLTVGLKERTLTYLLSVQLVKKTLLNSAHGGTKPKINHFVPTWRKVCSDLILYRAKSQFRLMKNRNRISQNSHFISEQFSQSYFFTSILHLALYLFGWCFMLCRPREGIDKMLEILAWCLLPFWHSFILLTRKEAFAAVAGSEGEWRRLLYSSSQSPEEIYLCTFPPRISANERPGPWVQLHLWNA